jgi:hypothetical protein
VVVMADHGDHNDRNTNARMRRPCLRCRDVAVDVFGLTAREACDGFASSPLSKIGGM